MELLTLRRGCGRFHGADNFVIQTHGVAALPLVVRPWFLHKYGYFTSVDLMSLLHFAGIPALVLPVDDFHALSRQDQGPSEADPYVRAVCFSPDGLSVVAGMEKNSAKVLVLGDGGAQQGAITLSGHEVRPGRQIGRGLLPMAGGRRPDDGEMLYFRGETVARCVRVRRFGDFFSSVGWLDW